MAMARPPAFCDANIGLTRPKATVDYNGEGELSRDKAHRHRTLKGAASASHPHAPAFRLGSRRTPSRDGRRQPPPPPAAAKPPDEDEAGDEAADVRPHGDPFRHAGGRAERGHPVQQLEPEPEDDKEGGRHRERPEEPQPGG